MGIYFTKLFSSITQSTVWCEPHTTRIVWITMLAMADKKGRIYSSIPGLANSARVTIEECEQALTRFMSPDKYSRTPDRDGRRIEPMDGGWRLLNYSKYREMRDQEDRLAYQREWDREHRKSDKSDKSDHKPTKAEAEAEAEKTKSKEVVGAKASNPPKIVQNLPLRDGSEFGVTDSFIAELEPLYPQVDIPATLKEMKGWLIGNKERRKTRRGIRSFIVRWLQNEQEKANGV